MSERLLLGDNLALLREHVVTSSVDLVYLDPPFASQRVYELGHRAGAPEEAGFDDVWRWGAEAERAVEELREGAPAIAALLDALRAAYGEIDLLAYLAMIAPRALELRRVLKPTGSLYVHCDPTASHYLKIVLDAVFGPSAFRNEIIWRYRRWPARSRQFQRMHDVLLFYSREATAGHTFNVLYGYERLADSTLKTFGTKRQVADFSSGRRKPSTEERESQGPPLSDVWEVGVIAASGKERVGYPTQKPVALLERVIRASSNEGDLVLDPFCGSGTTLVVAEKLGRRWLGMDQNPVALELARKRLSG